MNQSGLQSEFPAYKFISFLLHVFTSVEDSHLKYTISKSKLIIFLSHQILLYVTLFSKWHDYPWNDTTIAVVQARNLGIILESSSLSLSPGLAI